MGKWLYFLMGLLTGFFGFFFMALNSYDDDTGRQLVNTL